MEGLQCWKCGSALEEFVSPLPRVTVCPQCNADLHVCRMCGLYDTSVAKSCREPIAAEVRDKERANFCDYLELAAGAHEAGGAAAHTARNELAALFGLEAEKPPGEPADEARRKLEDLFGDDEPRG